MVALGGISLQSQEPQSTSGKTSPIRLGLASYTFRNFSRAQMIGFTKQLKITELNAKDVKDHLPMDARRKRLRSRTTPRRASICTLPERSPSRRMKRRISARSSNTASARALV